MTTPVMTLAELANYLKVHPSTIYRLLKRHELYSFKVGRDHRFNRESVDKWVIDRENKEHERFNHGHDRKTD